MKCFLLSVLLAFSLAGFSRIQPCFEESTTSSSHIFKDKMVEGLNSLPVSDKHTLQLITHGRPGELLIEGEWRNAPAIASFIQTNKLVTANINHINIYGCEFAKGETGLLAVSYLEKSLGVSIAASTNITGRDGDWILEVGKSKNIVSLPDYNFNLQCSAAPTVTAVGNTSCLSSNGSITVTNALTPAGDYEFSKDGGIAWQASNVFSNLASGDYNVRYRNKVSGTVVCTSSVLQTTVAASIVIPTTPAGTTTNTTACNTSTGAVQLNTYALASGNTNYEFSIDGTTWITANGSTTAPYGVIFSNLPAGSYNITARNKNTGCVSANSAAAVVGVSASTPNTPTGTATAATNCSSPNGTITLGTYAAASGSTNFEFSVDGTTWVSSNGTTTAPYGVTFTSLSGGVYHIVARNKTTGCTSANSANITVNAPTAPTTPAGSGVAPTSCSTPNGSVSLSAYTPTSGNTNYEFSIDGTNWTTTNGTTTAPYGVVFSNLVTGTYNIVARNKTTGCTASSANISVGSAAPAIPTTTIVGNTNCTTAPNGSITITNAAFTPLANYDFSITNGQSWVTGNNIFSNLAEGNYNIVVRNNVTGCVSPTAIANLTNTATAAVPTISAAGKTNPTSCSSPDGSLTVNGGTTPVGNYTFSIDGGANWQTSPTFSGLSGGVAYTIMAKSTATGCIGSSAATTLTAVSTPAPFVATGSRVNPTNCTTPNGSLTVTAGTLPVTNYTFSIDGGQNWQTSAAFGGLTDGSYTILAKANGTGCISTSAAYTLTAQAATVPTISAAAKTNPTNCSTPNGVLTVDGGTTPVANYTFSIDGGSNWQTSPTFNGLTSGIGYRILAKSNATGCIGTSAATTLTAPTATVPTISTGAMVNPTSCSSPNGSLTVDGGTTPVGNYTFSIDGGANWQISPSFSGLSGGVAYTILAKSNATGCIGTSAAKTLTAPAVTTPTVAAVSSTNCTTPNGTITITAPTPLSNYQFSKDDGITWQADANFVNVTPAANYNVRIKNISTGCISNAVATAIAKPDAVTAPVLSVNNLTNCNSVNGSIVFTSPSDSYNYSYSIDRGSSFSSNPSFTGLNSGTYVCAIKNNITGCVSVMTSTQQKVLTNGTPTLAATTSNATSCVPNGSITITTPAAGSGYTYSKDDGQTWQASNIFSNLDSGVYKIVAKNTSTDCLTIMTKKVVTNSAAISTPTTILTPQNCSALGAIEFTAPTLLSSYEFSINGGSSFSTNPSFSNVATGVYSIAARSLTSGCVSKIQNVKVEDARSAASCTDLDGDGILNDVDIDDDNDGVLDTVEGPDCVPAANDGNLNYQYWEISPALAGHDLLPISGVGGSNPINALAALDSYGLPTNAATPNLTGLVNGTGDPAGTATDGANIDIIRYQGWINFPTSFTGQTIKLRTSPGTAIVNTGAWVVSSDNNPANWKDPVDFVTDQPLLDMANTSGFYNLAEGGWDQGPIGYTDFATFEDGTTVPYPRNTAEAFTTDIVVSPKGHYFSAWILDPQQSWDPHSMQYSTDGGNTWITVPDGFYTSTNPCIIGELDTDNDGIPNRLDLDSDGDGCPDAVEASVYKTSGGPVMKSGNLQNGTGTGSVTSTQNKSNAAVAGPYNANGFANSIETAENGVYNGTYTYNLAINGTPSINCSNSIILPLRWISVTAILTSTGSKITWIAGSEEKVQQYEIFRSLDGVNFISIGKVSAFNNNASSNSYSYLDHDMLNSNSNKFYYYIRSIDFDNKTSRSKIVVAFKNNATVSIFVYPNPSGGEVHFNTLKDVSSIVVYNAGGSVVKQFKNINPTNLTYDLSNLSSGYYSVRLIKNNGEFVSLPLNVVK